MTALTAGRWLLRDGSGRWSVPADTLADVQIDASERAGSGRLGLLSRLLNDALASVATPGRATRVLDCGGGSGAMAVPLARAGAQVTVLDISADALATLRRRAEEAGTANLIRPIQGDAETLAEAVGTDAALAAAVPPASFDLVLAHGILEAVDDIAATFAGCATAVRPGGLLSVLVGNPPAAVLARALAGEPASALHELRELDNAAHRAGPELVVALCREAGFALEAQHGIGVFSDLVPGAALDVPGGRDALAALDAEAADRSPFAEIAGRVHVLARRPG